MSESSEPFTRSHGLILPSAHASIQALVQSRIMGNPQVREDGMDICGDKVEVEQMTVTDGIARIPINGVIGQKLSAIERGMGAVDVTDIRNDLFTALESDDVGSIILDIDSPGGTVGGVAELANEIAEAKQFKPITAVTDGLMASAAYWLGASATEIHATQSAEIGSIGVYMAMLDQSQAYADNGLSVELFTAGKYKAAGYPGTSLTDEQREHLQSGVDQIHTQFKSHVGNHRMVDASTMEGQTFWGPDALAAGLVDRIL